MLVWGFAGAIVGLTVGLLVGANIGGNSATGLNIGNLHGTEATGMLGAVLGGVMFTLLGVWLGLRRPRKPTPR